MQYILIDCSYDTVVAIPADSNSLNLLDKIIYLRPKGYGSDRTYEIMDKPPEVRIMKESAIPGNLNQEEYDKI